jgi:hypothetical protein
VAVNIEGKLSFRNAVIGGRKVSFWVKICLAISPEARQKYTRKRSRRSAAIGEQLGRSIDRHAVVRLRGAAICYHRAMPPPRRFPHPGRSRKVWKPSS